MADQEQQPERGGHIAYVDLPDKLKGYRRVQIAYLDGNGEYVNEIDIGFDGHITQIVLFDWR